MNDTSKVDNTKKPTEALEIRTNRI
jgi:hypothetical protein